MQLKTISWKIENDLGFITLDQPPANIMNTRFFDEFAFATERIIPSSSVKALIISGNGRHFSAGADTEELQSRIQNNLPAGYPDEIPGFLNITTRSFLSLGKLPIPTFASIRGACLGSAMELALFCKYRICAEGAVLGFPESSFGLMTGCGGSVILPRLTGRAKATEILLGGKNFSPEEAYKWGIIHKIVSRKIIMEETVKIASEIIKR
jgi:enoyl-CoA hydratase/carnithine racemase